MKTLKYILIVLLFNLLCLYAKAQLPKIEWRLENEKLTTPNTYQFDVYLYNIDTFNFELRAGTIAFFVNPLWRNGGTITISQLSSEMVSLQQNTIIQYYVQTSTNNEWWRNTIASGSLGLSTQVKSGSRVKLYTYRFTNSVAFSTTQTPNFAWKFAPPLGAGFNYSDPLNGGQTQVVNYYTTGIYAAAGANQKYCYTPSYWNGTQWVTKSQKTGEDTSAVLDKYHEVSIYNGTFIGKLDIRGYNLFPTSTHILNGNDTLAVRADFINLGLLNASKGSIQFKGNDIPGTARSQYSLSPIVSKNLIHKNPFHVYLGANANVSEILSFTKGKFILGANNLVLETNGISKGENDSAYVVIDSVGKLIIKNIGNNGKSGIISFPIGTFNDFNPVYLQNICTNNDFAMSIKKGVTDSSGNIINNNVVNKTWEIIELQNKGSKLNLKFEWKIENELPSFTRSNSYIAGKNISGKWLVKSSTKALGQNPFSQGIFNFIDLYNYHEFAIGSNGTIYNGNIDTTTLLQASNLDLTSNKPQANTSNVILYRIKVPISCQESGLSLQNIRFKLLGSFGYADIANLKLWFNTDSLLTTGSPILLANKTMGLDTGIHLFTGLNQNFNIGFNYIFLTSDVLCTSAKKTIITLCEDIFFNTTQQMVKSFKPCSIIIQHSIGDISGPSIDILNNVPYTYRVDFKSNTSYNWNVTNGTILRGQGTNNIVVEWSKFTQGSIQLISNGPHSCIDTIILNVNITDNLSCNIISGLSATDTIPNRGTNNVLLYRLDFNILCKPIDINGIQFRTLGNYSINDIRNFKIWYHNNSSFSTGIPILLATKTNNLIDALQNISFASKNLDVGKHYFFITADINCLAKNSILIIDSILQNDLFFLTDIGKSMFINNNRSILNIGSDTLVDSIKGEFTSVIDSVSYIYQVSKKNNVSYVWSVENGLINSGQGTNSVVVMWTKSGLGKLKVIAYNTQSCSDSSEISVQVQSNIPLILLSNSDPQQNIPSKGASNIIIYKINLYVQRFSTNLKAVNFSTIGTYQTEDLNNIKLWYHTNPVFTNATPILLGTKTLDIDPGLISFQGLNKNLDTGKYYLFITIDLPCKANNKVITVSPIDLTNISFSSGVVIGDNFTTKPVTINPLPVVANIAGQRVNLKTNSIYSYSLTQLANISYVWSVINGVIISGQGTSAVEVKWNKLGNGSVSVIGTNTYFCIDTTSLNVTITSNSGIDKLEMANNFFIYPNPNNGDFIIKLESNRKSSSKFSLYNMLGQEVWSNAHELSMGENEISLNTNLSAGMYVLKIHSDSEELIKQVVIR